jgi:hypothetical protein
VNSKKEEMFRAMGTASINVEDYGDNFSKY